MSNVGSISPSLEDYVEVIFDLLRDNGVARVGDVARRKDVRMASVNNAVKRLVKEEMINHESYKTITLTEKGRKLAKNLNKRHSIIQKFLQDIVKIDPEIADRDACTIEHHVHKETMDGLIKFIKSFDVKKMTKAKTNLKNIMPGKSCKIKKIHITGEIKQRLLEMGLNVGEEVLVERVAPLGDPINIKVKRYHLSLRKKEAESIEVEELGK